MKKSEINIDKLRFNPFSDDIVDIIESEYGVINIEEVDKNKVMAYLILFYDLNTPLRTRYPDILERRLRCADLCEFPKKDKVYVKEYENIMVGENYEFNNLSYQYIHSFGMPELVELHLFEKYLAELYVKSTYEFEPKDYKDSILNIKSLRSDINRLTEEIFGGKETLNMRIALYKGMEKDIKMPRPEAIAMAENLDELILNPYGEDYKVSELKFKSNK